MPDVPNPPSLIAQETGAWCFAAAEQIVRAYYELEERTQYEIARAFTSARALVEAELGVEWQTAVLMDATAEPPELEEGGANLNSAVVQLVRSEYGVFNQDATGGAIVGLLTEGIVRAEIDVDRVLVIGNSIHYYVVIGYDGAGDDFRLHVLDPWPPGGGGQRDWVTFAEFQGWVNKVAITFGE